MAPGVYLLTTALSHTILWACSLILLMLTQLTCMHAIYLYYNVYCNNNIQNYNILSEFQHGFRPGYSC